ncbi:MAG: helix-turn-helix domain-containing protein [Clostridium sp.]|nr:helix-turn-helix domain-containing protein [Clostridium sp.]MCM1399077.1 helix-turn-helix domain-containing protein [Clostridium sp.]MCM1459468.1 helix-turn-helix domain-containing protein [Bacteroides sp.]
MDNFMIKDATKRLGIEAHVLRYWEEELGLEIKRNSMGHRYYEEKDLRMFGEIKRLRADGVSLKDIKKSIDGARKKSQEMKKEAAGSEAEQKMKPEEVRCAESRLEENKQETNKPEANKSDNPKNTNKIERDMGQQGADRDGKEKNTELSTGGESLTEEQNNIVDFKIAQMQTLMNRIVANAFRENKGVLTSTIKSEITEDVMKQMDVIMREKEEREEARFRKLDEYLRQIQRANEEVAATKSKRLFGRKRH